MRNSCHSIYYVIFNSFPSDHLSFRNPLGLPISKRDSLLEKCTMFREAGIALSRQASQDNGLDDPFSSGTSKLEQVLGFVQLLCDFIIASHQRNSSQD